MFRRSGGYNRSDPARPAIPMPFTRDRYALTLSRVWQTCPEVDQDWQDDARKVANLNCLTDAGQIQTNLDEFGRSWAKLACCRSNLDLGRCGEHRARIAPNWEIHGSSFGAVLVDLG